MPRAWEWRQCRPSNRIEKTAIFPIQGRKCGNRRHPLLFLKWGWCFHSKQTVLLQNSLKTICSTLSTKESPRTPQKACCPKPYHFPSFLLSVEKKTKEEICGRDSKTDHLTMTLSKTLKLIYSMPILCNFSPFVCLFFPLKSAFLGFYLPACFCKSCGLKTQ